MSAPTWAPVEATDLATPTPARPWHITPADWERKPWAARMRAARNVPPRPAPPLPVPAAVAPPEREPEPEPAPPGPFDGAPGSLIPPPTWVIAAHANLPAVRYLARTRDGHITHPHPTARAGWKRRRNAARTGHPITP